MTDDHKDKSESAPTDTTDPATDGPSVAGAESRADIELSLDDLIADELDAASSVAAELAESTPTPGASLDQTFDEIDLALEDLVPQDLVAASTAPEPVSSPALENVASLDEDVEPVASVPNIELSLDDLMGAHKEESVPPDPSFQPEPQIEASSPDASGDDTNADDPAPTNTNTNTDEAPLDGAEPLAKIQATEVVSQAEDNIDDPLAQALEAALQEQVSAQDTDSDPLANIDLSLDDLTADSELDPIPTIDLSLEDLTGDLPTNAHQDTEMAQEAEVAQINDTPAETVGSTEREASADSSITIDLTAQLAEALNLEPEQLLPEQPVSDAQPIESVPQDTVVDGRSDAGIVPPPPIVPLQPASGDQAPTSLPADGQRIEIRMPDDWHLHLRDGEMLSAVVPASAEHFSRAIIMPNLVPPVVTRAQALAYRNRIRAAVPEGLEFQPLMTLYLTETTDVDDLARGFLSGDVTAAKLYPAGATTNSDSGVRDVTKIDPVLARMADIGMPLLIHGEVTDPDVDIFDREAVFIERVLKPMRRRHPDLKIVLEHITTREGVDYVRNADGPIAATITVHHLMINRNALFKGGIRPHYFCLPIAKREIHRLALVDAAVSGNPRFFLGTDSAPHLNTDKESPCGCAGVFSAPVAMSCLAQIFDDEGRLEMLEGFTSLHGPAFYGVAANERRCVLERTSAPIEIPLDVEVMRLKRVKVFDPERPIFWRMIPPDVQSFDFDFDLGDLSHAS